MNYPTTTNIQLMATCFFMKSGIKLEDYTKYYPQEKFSKSLFKDEII